MGYKWIDSYFSLVALFLTFLFLALFENLQYFMGGFGDWVIISRYFLCDSVSLYLCLLSAVLWASLSFFMSRNSMLSCSMISLSVIFSILCYCCTNAFFFWVFYEMSILSLLLLLVLESPYSERYVASWYLMGYVMVTSLPMLACLFYLSFEEGSFNLSEWVGLKNSGYIGLLLVFLAVLFITKIPLFPFHVWLPIVHAEASSIVSVCLSGYIMKLGVLGGFRFCSRVLPDYVFSYTYCVFVLFFSVLFFFSASRELDGKRWLALLSLSHIIMPVVCLGIGGFNYINIAFFYCLGHGLSAGVTFILLWLLYDVTGSRNWFLVKSGVSNSVFVRFCCGSCLCTVASLPPTIQFFSEVLIVCLSTGYSLILVLGIFIYLFLGGLVPMFLLGGLLTRHYSISFGSGLVYSSLCSVVFLVLWSFLLFLII